MRSWQWTAGLLLLTIRWADRRAERERVAAAVRPDQISHQGFSSPPTNLKMHPHLTNLELLIGPTEEGGRGWGEHFRPGCQDSGLPGEPGGQEDFLLAFSFLLPGNLRPVLLSQ